MILPKLKQGLIFILLSSLLALGCKKKELTNSFSGPADLTSKVTLNVVYGFITDEYAVAVQSAQVIVEIQQLPQINMAILK